MGKKNAKKDLSLRCNNRFLADGQFFSSIDYDQFLFELDRYRSGVVIPEDLDLHISTDSGFFFGTVRENGHYVGKPASLDGHILVTGYPGSSKSTGLVMPTMMTWRGCQVILDVKGNLRRCWMKANSYHHKKLLIFSPSNEYGCRYDPYALLRSGGNEKLAGNAYDLAQALIPLNPTVKDPIWIKAAQNFLTGAILYYFSIGCSFVETMAAIQTTPVSDQIKTINDSDILVAKVYINLLGGIQDKIIANIGMELSTLVAFVTDVSVFKALSPEDGVELLDWAAISTSPEPFDVILEFPEACLERWNPVVHLLVNQLIKTLEQRPERTYKAEYELPPLLVLLDEFQRLGKISAITNGLATLRSRGVTFALVIQSVQSLDGIYGPATARVIADLCAFKAVLGVSDPVSQKYFSDLVGTTITMQRSFNITQDQFDGRISVCNQSISETREPIIHPHEFLTLKDVVLITPCGFCRACKTNFMRCANAFMRLLSPVRHDDQHDFLSFSYSAKGKEVTP